MGEEYQALVDNGTWEHVAAPNDSPLLQCRWVFKIKRNGNGGVLKYKARLVAKGFAQEPDVNFLRPLHMFFVIWGEGGWGRGSWLLLAAWLRPVIPKWPITNASAGKSQSAASEPKDLARETYQLATLACLIQTGSSGS